jgi:hypothetical protein
MSEKTYEDFFNDENKKKLYAMIERLSKFKGQRISFENYRKVLKARLMKKAMLNGCTAVQAQEREAYSHQEYERVVEAIQIATEEETKAYWELEMFRTEIDVWRTEQANNRRIMD